MRRQIGAHADKLLKHVNGGNEALDKFIAVEIRDVMVIDDQIFVSLWNLVDGTCRLIRLKRPEELAL